MTRRSLIIDCDPGVDDAIAILMALASSAQFNLLGITTVAGNVPLKLTQLNARKICQLAGAQAVPVFAGCPRPLLRSLVTAEEVHGETGLQVNLPDPQHPLQTQHGVSFLIEQLMGAAAPITLATLGPLTNLAVALIQQPGIANQIGELVMMGGSITQGNITPSAEFNLHADPHAAKVVFEAGLKPTVLGLDVTHTVLTTPKRLNQIRQIGSAAAIAAADMLAFYGAEEAARLGIAGAPLHDPCVIAYLLKPDLFKGQDAYIEVETISPLTLGRTVVDINRATNCPPNAHIIRTANADGIYKLLIECLKRL